MSVAIKVVLEGLPERIQEAADTLDRAFPGMINWHRLATLGQNYPMRLEGVALPRDEALNSPDQVISPSTTSKVCKPSPAAGQWAAQSVLHITRESALSVEKAHLALMKANQPGQSCFKSLHVAEDPNQSQTLILTFEQFEALCSARDEKAFLFIAMPSVLDENEEVTVIIVDGLDPSPARWPERYR